jgi:hypothetical protein
MERQFGKPPHDDWEKIHGFDIAIENTKRKIDEYIQNNWDTSELTTHLKNLEDQLKNLWKRPLSPFHF